MSPGRKRSRTDSGAEWSSWAGRWSWRGWFHQDFDLHGDTLEELIDEYKKGTPPDDLGGARADIKRFLRQTPRAQIEEEFVRLFKPGVDPKRWAATVEEWLSDVWRLLSAG